MATQRLTEISDRFDLRCLSCGEERLLDVQLAPSGELAVVNCDVCSACSLIIKTHVPDPCPCCGAVRFAFRGGAV